MHSISKAFMLYFLLGKSQRGICLPSLSFTKKSKQKRHLLETEFSTFGWGEHKDQRILELLVKRKNEFNLTKMSYENLCSSQRSEQKL